MKPQTSNHTLRLALILIVLALAGLACQTVVEGLQPPTATSVLAPPTEDGSPLPSETALSTPTATLTPIDLQQQIEIFEDLWEIVNEDYLYPDFNGVDWDEVRVRYRQRIEAGLDTETFYLTMDEMIFELNDEHSAFLNPQQVAAEEAEFAGENNYVGIGVWIQFLPEKDKAVVLLTFPGGPAAQAGIKSHDSILSVEGVTMEDEDGAAIELLLGIEGTEVTFEIQTPGEEPREMTLTRSRINSPIPVPYETLITPGGKRIGYIILPTFGDSTVDKQVGDALEALTADGSLDGLILDNRLNGGGWDTVASSTLGYFTSGLVGHFSNRDGDEAFRVRRNNVGGSVDVPLVVLVGPDTVSFGEIFAGVLKDQGRATIIGETTLGNVEILWGYSFSDGSRAWIAHDRFVPTNNPEADWEHLGIAVDIEAPADWDEHTLETDPAVWAALEHFDGE
jgi:C-terminal peptidase prc